MAEDRKKKSSGDVRVLAILQARFSSSRLPGKVMEPILGRPMLQRQLERLARVRGFDRLLVATSDHESDRPIVDLCRGLAVDCFQGSLDDVLDRFYRAASAYNPDHVVRLTGDCPLADPEVIDRIIEFYLAGDYDYASNTLEPTFPDGLDAEVVGFSALERAWREAKLPSQREHVTPFIHGQPGLFRLGSFKNEDDLSAMRWTVDEPVDLEFVRRVYEELYPGKPGFSTSDVLDLLARKPELQNLNADIERNEGLKKSLLEDGLSTRGNKDQSND